MADNISLQQPPQKKIRLTGNGTESDFDFKMISAFDTAETNPNLDPFDSGTDFNDPMDNSTTIQQTGSISNPTVTHYQNQVHVNYQPSTRAPMPTYQNPQRVTAMPSSAIVRQVNGTQQQTIVYHQQPLNTPSRPVYPRLPTGQQSNLTSSLVQPNYNSSAMVPMGNNVAQMNIVKASDPNNNNVFVTANQTTGQQQQQGTLITLSNQHTVTQPTKHLSTALPSLTSQQFNSYSIQRAAPTNTVTTYSNRPPMVDQATNNGNTYHISPQTQTVPTAPTPHLAPSTSTTTTGTNNNTGGTSTSQTTEIQRKQFIQKQLVLLLHAHKCQQREKLPANGDSTRSNSCTLPHCNTMKSVLQHMTRCTDHKNCHVQHCVTSRQIILHWKQCTNSLCPICQPLKSPPTHSQTLNQIINAPNGNNSSTGAPTSSKEWQRRVTQEMRNHLVQKIIAALIPNGNDTGIMRDKRIVNLTNYARRVESETFDIATNQEEYFHKLAEKIYRIQKELEDRREKKRLQDLQVANGGSSNSVNDFAVIKRTSTIDMMSGTNGPPNRVAPSTDLISLTTIKTEGSTNLSSNNSRSIGMIINQNQTTSAAPNVSSNDSLSFLLNDDQTNSTPSLSDTNRAYSDGSSLKVEPSSPKISASLPASVVKKEENPNPPIDASSKQLPKHPIQFSREELCLHLQPVIDKMILCEDSAPFRQPVDPVALNILDYPTIIKHPMDISTIQKKLSDGEYGDPLKFAEDAWLMFDNAWLYNRKTTRVYRMCTKLSEVFAEAFDPAAQKLGYCCGRMHVYLPQVMFCYGNQLCCQIARDGSYYYYNNTDLSRFNLSGDKYTFCAKCFDAVKGELIAVGDDPAQTLVELPKNQFHPAKNDTQEPEAMINCVVCSRRWHQVCALHFDNIWPEGFVCPTCVKQYNIRRKESRFTASRLTTTDLALRLEQRVNDFLRHEKCQTGRVIIRILAASDKLCEVKPRLKKYHAGQVPEGYPYRTKAIFAFQEIEGVDVVLFGMHVQEYDGRCPAPNARRVYISYLDSVHFFRPKHLRTDVYHEILIGYLDYAKQLGFVYAHIWACPPSEGDDYIFHCHPPEQRVPKPKRLQDWYKKMLDRALLERVIYNYKDVMKDCLDNQVQNAWSIPYFEGDFWANIIEESIKELDQEVEERRKQEMETARAIEDGNLDESFEAEDPTDISDKRKSATTHKKKNLKKTASNQRKIAKKQMSNCTDLISRVFATMEKHKEAFFVIQLHDQVPSLPTISDTDTLIQCDLMDTRDAFLNFARDKHYEFSSLRRAKFSTLALLCELHTSTNDKFSYNCNSCRQQCEVRYHCTECEDFDLCEKCYNMEPKHKHRMERSTPGVVDDGDQNSSQANGKSVVSTQLQRQQSMQRCIDALLHAVNCRNANCFNRSCFRYKRVILHTKECKGKNSQCNICKQVIFLCWYHAKTCVDPNCQVPFCTNLKSKIQKQRATSLQTDRRRMQAMMQQRSTATITSQTSTSGTSTVFRTDSSQGSSFESTSMSNQSGKPSVTSIRTSQPTNWQNTSTAPTISATNQSYVIAQKPSNGKLSGYHSVSITANPLTASANRAKQESSLDETQRTDTTEQKQPMFAPLISKAPVTRLPSNAFNQQQPQWFATTPSQSYTPPPTYNAATRARYPSTSQQQNSSVLQTLIAPARPTMSPSGYLNRPTLTRPPLNVNLPRVPSTQPQDPNLR